MFAFEQLARCELAALLKTETEIVYDVTGKITDLEILVDGHKIGDTVTACPGSLSISIEAYRGDGAMGHLDTIGVYVNGALRDEIETCT